MRKIIAYSLWGDNPKYTYGAVQNARDAAVFYPGWTPRFYCAASVSPDIIRDLEEAGAEIMFMNEEGARAVGPFWRFYALEDAGVDLVLMRDADSRLSRREAEAVCEWLSSGLSGHIMRDHIYHSEVIMAGMWGAKAAPFRDIRARIAQFAPTDVYGQDQHFLERHIYPRLLAMGLCVHDEFYNYEGAAGSFPSDRIEYAFVGEIFDAQNRKGPEWKALRKYEQSAMKRFRFAVRRLLFKVRYAWRMRRLCKEGNP